jgi:hypothetical protein
MFVLPLMPKIGVLLFGQAILPMKGIWKKLFRHLNLVAHLFIRRLEIPMELILTIGSKIE